MKQHVSVQPVARPGRQLLVGYGRGALRFHRATNGGARFKPDLTFYRKLLHAAVSQTRLPRAAQLTRLLLWAQTANAAGFFYEQS